MITDLGRLLCDTAKSDTLDLSEEAAYIYYLGERKKIYATSSTTNALPYMCRRSYAYLADMFGGFKSNSTTVTMNFGSEIIKGLCIDRYYLYAETLENEVTCVSTYNEKTKMVNLKGIMENKTDKQLVINYFGKQGTLNFKDGTSGAGSVTGLLYYIKLPIPIILEPNQTYSFKLEFDITN